MTERGEDKNMGFVPVTGKRVSEAIFAQIQEKILSGELKPNDRLPSERTLMEIFQRSRPTIREALRMLERSGMIMTIPGSGGAVIKEISPANVEQPLEGMVLQKSVSPIDLYEFRIINEIANVEWAAQRRTDEDIASLRQIITRAENSKNDWAVFFECDINFHMAVVQAGKNQMSVIIHNVISQLVSDIISRGFTSLTSQEREQNRKNVISSHKAILAAIIDRDAESAKQTIIRHMGEFRHFMKDENIGSGSSY